MPNGKPGDHPLTDVLVHGHEVFGPRVDGLIREINGLGGGDVLAREFDWGALDPIPPPGPDAAGLAALEADLTRLRDRLLAAGAAEPGT